MLSECIIRKQTDKTCASQSHLLALGFSEETTHIDAFAISDLQGGTMDAFGKVSRFAKGVLPLWIICKFVKQPSPFN